MVLRLLGNQSTRIDMQTTPSLPTMDYSHTLHLITVWPWPLIPSVHA